MLAHNLTALLLAAAVAFGVQFLPSDASALPGDIIGASRAKGKRTYKGKKGSGASKKETKSKSSTTRSSSNRRVVRTTTAQKTAPSRTNVRSRRTVTRTRPSTGHTTTTRTVRHTRPRTTTTTHRTHSQRTSHRRLRGHNVRRTTYHSSHHSHHAQGHATGTRSSTRTSSRSGRTHGRSTIDPYVTGGLGISGFASNDIVDGALPGLGYNLAIGAKGKLFGGEFGVNGGGYTLDTANASTDIALIGLSGDLKLQPSFSFFEPYIAVGLGGYAMQDAVIEESSAGFGVRLGAGADFRFDNIALRVHYLYGAYGLGNNNGSYNDDGSIAAKTETLGANLVVYF